ncbi:MAG: hypothetical protein JST84_03200 [Acidobacteria bacterium]|nr:hypothetical protein [Acidobacteriota bacterium]
MTTHTKLQTITLNVLAFIAASLFSLAAQAQVQVNTLPTAQTITGLELTLRRSNGDTMRYAVNADGSFSLGQLAEGSYTLSLSFNTLANAKSFYESRSNTTRSVTVIKAAYQPVKGTGVQESKVVIWDPKLNQMAEINNMVFRPVQAIAFDVKAGEEVSGNIAAFGPKDWPTVQSN